MFTHHWKFQAVLLFVFGFCASYATGYGFGVFQAFRDVLVGTFGTFALLLVIASLSPRIAIFILKTFIITTILYFPIGWLYGSPTFKTVGGLLESNPNEVMEFFEFLPTYLWFLHLLYLVLGVMVWRFVPPLFHQLKHLPKKWLYYLHIITAITLLTPLITNRLTGAHFQDDESAIPVNLVGFYVDLTVAPYTYWDKKNKLIVQANQPSTWHIDAVTPKYQNHVVVIGESARKDYLHAYGFSLENTPFVSQSNGLLIDGYISTADFTMASLPRTLSLPQESHNNLISLAKQAGFYTAWLSNQGMLGFFSNEVSSYAVRSDYVFFTQRGDYQKSLGMSDRMLLPKLKYVLKQPIKPNQPRLIVMHIMGSHQDFCQRLDNGVQFEYRSQKMSCYVSTIKETDDFLRDVVDILKAEGQSYSVIYFSDHGLKHTGTGSQLTLTHGGGTYQSYEVPLIRLSSDDNEQTIITTQRSAFNFLKGFGQWTGIQTKELHDEGYDFWGKAPDLPSVGNNLEQVNRLKQDNIE